MTTTIALPPTTCPTCEGAGEVGTRQDYWGNWETARCGTCRGAGVLTADERAEYDAECCAHGVHDMADRLCWDCVREREADRKNNPWASGASPVKGGWDAEPPF